MSQLRKRETGSALILVMGVLVLLSIIGTTFVALMRIETGATRNFSEDARARDLALGALAFCSQHPTWNPPRDPLVEANNDVDSDGYGGKDCQLFTEPLSGDLASDAHARYAILKKPFGGRLNLNWNSFYTGPNSDNQVLNDGVSPGEISLVDSITAYLDYLGTLGVPVGTSAQNRDAAREIARRVCNRRYGVPPGPLTGTAADPPGNVPRAKPGEDALDDDSFLDDSTLAVGVAPAGRDADDDAAWAAPSWRPDPAVDGIDNNGDGIVDEAGEQIDEQDEFKGYPPPALGGGWPVDDDQPFDSTDLLSIVNNSGSDIKTIVNYVCQNYPGFNPAIDYFDYLRVLFTTYSRDYIGDMTPLNHLNLLPSTSGTADDIALVTADRAKFIAALESSLEEGGVKAEAADLTAWQTLANLIDYLDTDLDPGGSGDDWGIVTVLVKSEGWNQATDDRNGDGEPSLWDNAGTTQVEPHCRAFFGTERFPYINELWIYNRGTDRFDNDGDGVVDNDPAAVPPDPLPQEVDRDAYFIELTNQYATDVVLYNNPANPTDPTVDWYIRILDSVGSEVLPHRRFSSAQIWSGGAWVPAAGTGTVRVKAGGYLTIESRDYSSSDNPQLAAAGLKQLPDPSALPSDVLVNLNLPNTVKLFQGDYTVELVYSYDPDGTGPDPAEDVVVDRQKLTSQIGSDYASPPAPVGTYDFAPSWERHDPRIARCIRGASGVGGPLVVTWPYSAAETATAGTGGDDIRNTLGAVNDADDSDADPFDGNYDLGSSGTTRYDDLVSIPNKPDWKFANVGGLGSLLAVGPLPPDPTLFGWSGDFLTVTSSADDYWLVKCSPYTAVPGTGADYFSKNYPLDAKKIDFTSSTIVAWDSLSYDVNTAPNKFPTGRAQAIFDKFTVFCPWKDGKDNDGDWLAAADDADGDGGPSPGDPHVDESDEVYAYGRVDVNDADAFVMAALPYVEYDDSTFHRPGGPGHVPGVFVTATADTAAVPNVTSIYEERDSGGPFKSRKDFVDRVVKLLTNATTYNPAGNVGAFGKDIEDNQVCDNGAGTPRRTAVLYEWDTSQRPPRTANTIGAPYDFILPGQAGDGGDLLTDDKSETDYTVGALMNMISLESELPAAFASGGADLGIYTYYITVQITDGLDVNGNDVAFGDEDGDALGIHEPDWDEGTVLAEKRIVALVNTNLPLSDPKRITVFNWSFEGRAPVK